MEKIKFYTSNSGLGHRQFVVLLMLGNKDLLVVNTDFMEGGMYSLGQIITDNDKELFIVRTTYDMRKCEFLNSFLGKYFMKHYFKISL